VSYIANNFSTFWEASETLGWSEKQLRCVS